VAEIDVIDPSRIEKALALAAKRGPVVASYVFGSQAEGTADSLSDVDLAIFVQGAESWGLEERVEAIVEIQRLAGDDIDVHFFPATQHANPAPASFAAYVMQHGVPLRG